MLKQTSLVAGLLLASACFLLIAPRSVRSQESASSIRTKYEYFQDKNRVWNHTPVVEWIQALSRKWKIGWEQEWDIVSGASRRLGSSEVNPFLEMNLDGTSGASKVELRHSESPSITYAHQGLTFGAGLYTSHENDYTSWSPSANVSFEFNERNTTVGLSFAEFFDKFEPKGPFSSEGGDKRIHSVNATLAQLLSPLTLVALTTSYIQSNGYLGHPYNPPTNYTGVLMTENVPGNKKAMAIAGQIVQGFQTGERLNSINLDFRTYGDDWGLQSLTADLKFNRYIGETTVLRLRGRYYKQSSVDFAKTYYAGNELYRTADIRHFAFKSLLGGIKLTSTFPETWEESGFLPDSWDIKFDYTWRDTHGDHSTVAPGMPRTTTYQLYAPSETYNQGVLMVGLNFNLP